MDFQCVCGQVLSMEVEPGTVVKCPACGQMIQVPSPASAYGPAGWQPSSPFAAAPRTSGMAIAALVLGIAAMIFGPITGIPAIILGAVAVSKVGKSQGQLSGSGLAIAGLATGAVFSIIFTALVLHMISVMSFPIRARNTFATRAMNCASNLRHISIAITQYTITYDGLMPRTDINTFALLQPYLGEPDAFQCPEDRDLPERNPERFSSYAFNSSLSIDENEKYSPFSTARLGKPFRSIPDDTILAVEMWTRAGPDGTFPNELRLDSPDRSLVAAGAVLLSNYEATSGATFDEAGRLVDPGPYRFLECYRGTAVSVRNMYHYGRINVLFVDGHVESMSLRELVAESPSRSRGWTARRDRGPSTREARPEE